MNTGDVWRAAFGQLVRDGAEGVRHHEWKMDIV